MVGKTKRGTAGGEINAADPDVAGTAAMAWRAKQRKILKERRAAIAIEEKAAIDGRIANQLTNELCSAGATTVAVYWPLRGEPDLRVGYTGMVGAGLVLFLPVVIGRQQPLEFRIWNIDEPLVRDALNIPCPAAGPSIRPDIIVTPCVGFDAEGYRLGNGGGYYDRTFAVAKSRPLLIGVAYESLRLHGIRPQPHDVPMDLVITEEKIYRRESNGD